MFVLSSIVISQPSADESSMELSDQPTDKMDWWRDARFGMFIHWGLYAVPAGEHMGKRTDRIGEWIMHHLNIPIKEYETYAQQFNPVKFDAQAWVALAKEAGMKYMVITSKHHDGFCLWDSKVTDWDVLDASPFKRDILRELADACERESIRLCFYHSIMDWHHPDAQAINEPNYNSRDPKSVNPNFSRYFQNYLKPQVKELMTGYGDIGVMWFDGEWIPDYTTEMGKELYQEIVDADPDMIINNRVDKGRQGMQGMNKEGEFAGDFGTPEQEIPDQGLAGVDWESCMTMNDTWGFKHFDQNWKSAETLIHNLIDIASKGGNYLLNVGPTGAGEIPEASVKRLADIGTWMKTNGEAIYGTSASPFDKPAWGRYTQKDNLVFVHIFDWPKDGKLTIPDQGMPFQEAQLWTNKGNVKVDLKKNADGWIVSLPAEAPNDIASVVALKK
ncbi:MAG: alpha-L-fucosidase [Saprospiraceae bacterium]|nr:alpha-L-fucosidase [Saprospiraceae bacterium]